MATKVGFIGVGDIASAHMPNVGGREDTQISAVCDIDESRAQAAAQKWGATPYTDYRQMIDKESLNAVYVCLWPSVHGTIELDLCEHEIPFFTEKPVNLDLAAAKKRTVTRSIKSAYGKGSINLETRNRYLRIYRRAVSVWKRLGFTRKKEPRGTEPGGLKVNRQSGDCTDNLKQWQVSLCALTLSIKMIILQD